MKIYASKEYVEEKIVSSTIQSVPQTLTEEQQMQARENLDLYRKTGGMVEVLPETTQAPDGDTNGIAMTFVPESGKTYIVNWNGTTYECLAYEVTDEGITGIIFGNSKALADWGVTSEECDAPFIAMYAPEQMAAFVVLDASALDESGNVTLSVYCNDTVINAIEPEYLPSGVPYVIETEGELTDTLTFDGDTTGKEVVTALSLVKVSNKTITLDELVGCVITPVKLDESSDFISESVTLTEDMITDWSDEGMNVLSWGQYLFVAYEDVTSEGITLTKGIHFVCAAEGYISSLSASIPIFMTGDSVKIGKLDNRCLDLEWYAAPDEEVIMEPTVFSFESGMAQTTGFDHSTVPVVEGGLYRVYLDGVKYDTICRLMHDETDLAARSYVLFNESHFVEVRYAVDLGWLVVYLISGASGPHTVAITQKIYNPISIEYIPDCVLTKDNTNWLAKKEENVTVIDEWINALGRSDLTTDTVKCYLSNRSKASLDSTLFDPNKCYRLDIEQGSRYVFDVQKTVRYAGSKTTTHRSTSFNTSDVEAEVYYFTATGEMPDMDNIDLSLLPIYEYVVPLDATYANLWLYLPMDCEIDTTQYGICYRFVEVETTHNSLPEEYFPEEIGSFVMRSSTEGSTKRFRVTIDDTGAFAAAEITE